MGDLMKNINKRDLKEKAKDFFKNEFNKILAHSRLKKLWIFGIIVIGFAVPIRISLIPVILLLMIVLTLGTTQEIKEENREKISQLYEEKEELQRIITVTQIHINEGNATLQEKIELSNLEAELERIEQDIISYEKR